MGIRAPRTLSSRTVWASLSCLVLLLFLPAGTAGAAVPAGSPGPAGTLTQIASGGFSGFPDGGSDIHSWQNSYPWSMKMFRGDLYVATGRVGCTSSVMALMTGVMGGGMLPLPGGADPPPPVGSFLSADKVSVTDDAAFASWNATSRAEIWRLRDGVWTRVYRAAMVPSYLAGPSAPYAAAEIAGFRCMTVMKDRNGEEAIYAAAGGFTFAAQQPLMMRSTDGVTWTRVYAPPAIGRESRALCAYNGRIYIGVGYAGVGPGVAAGAWASDLPADPLSWTKVIDFPSLDAGNTNVISFGEYLDRLYIGTENRDGFEVWRATTRSPSGNGDWVPVVSGGAGDPQSAWAGTMTVFKGHLYVGSMTVAGVTGTGPVVNPFDLIRIGPKDEWELVIGDPRTVPTTSGTRSLTPLSGEASGFGNPLNAYCWSLEVFGGRLYLGTFDASTFVKVAQENGVPLGAMLGLTPAQIAALIAGAGGDLYRSRDGRSWEMLTLTGFGDPDCYGFRNIVAAPGMLYFGLSNPFYGCELWQLRSPG